MLFDENSKLLLQGVCVWGGGGGGCTCSSSSYKKEQEREKRNIQYVFIYDYYSHISPFFFTLASRPTYYVYTS